MRLISCSIGTLFLAAAFASPAPMLAAPTPQDVQVRVYDEHHKDYHNWDEREDRAWHRYLKEKHRKYHEFNKAEKREQEEYWDWRHDHPDHD